MQICITLGAFRLQKVSIEGKGYGVITTREFKKDELLCESAGDLVSYSEGIKREQEYSNNTDIGCYMYFFKHKGKYLW